MLDTTATELQARATWTHGHGMHMHMFAYLLTCLLARVLASHDVTPPLLTLTCTLVYSPLPQVVESIFKLQDGTLTLTPNPNPTSGGRVDLQAAGRPRGGRGRGHAQCAHRPARLSSRELA